MACHKDLHSVYIDGEMPDAFVGKYESLVSSDPKIAEARECMVRVHELLKEDSDDVSSAVSDEFMEKSFERLQSKMRHSKTVQFSRPKKIPSAAIPVSVSAAAAVFACVYIPSSMKSYEGISHPVEISAIAGSELTPLDEIDVKIDGNIHSEKLPEVFAAVAMDVKSSSAPSEQPSAVSDDAESADSSVQKTVRASAVVSNSTRRFSSSMTSVDVFRPNFINSDE